MTEVAALWPDCKIVRGKPCHSQSQGSVERANQDIESILACWMKDKLSNKWSESLRFVQWMKNNLRLHSGIGRSPYKAMFGKDPHVGLSDLNIQGDLINNITSEEDLEEILPSQMSNQPDNIGGDISNPVEGVESQADGLMQDESAEVGHSNRESFDDIIPVSQENQESNCK